jgi:transposase
VPPGVETAAQFQDRIALPRPLYQAAVDLPLARHSGGQPRVVPPNITIIALPSKSPELNPVENIWQFMRDDWLSSRVFKSCNNLVEHCCEAWNKLTDQPWRIMSVGMCWAYRF